METLSSTPVLNTPCYNPLDLDEVGLYRGLEMVAFPRTFVEVQKTVGAFYEVLVDGYPSSNPLYVPKVLVGPGSGQKRITPSKEVILERLLNTPKLPYVWGGNVSKGVTMDKWFPPPKGISTALWNLQGIDCSGLLYEAADGSVPRNTSDLVHYGEEVTGDVKRLDICMLPGHMFIVIGDNLVVESKYEWGGVVYSKLDERLKLVEEPFVFRRFF